MQLCGKTMNNSNEVSIWSIHMPRSNIFIWMSTPRLPWNVTEGEALPMFVGRHPQRWGQLSVARGCPLCPALTPPGLQPLQVQKSEDALFGACSCSTWSTPK